MKKYKDFVNESVQFRMTSSAAENAVKKEFGSDLKTTTSGRSKLYTLPDDDIMSFSAGESWEDDIEYV